MAEPDGSLFPYSSQLYIGRGFLDAQDKVKLLHTHFTAEQDEFLSFLLLRCTIWTELLLAPRYRTTYTWARNFAVGRANKFHAALQTIRVRPTEFKAPTTLEMQQMIKEIAAEVQE
ncbi:MAG: hypothetical protein ACFFD2_09040 [Promethearchaeota archaeon]